MVNYKRLLEMNWLWHKPVQQWYQSRRSKSWEKPIHNRMQKGFEKGYLLREGAANTLPRSKAMVETSEKKIVIPCTLYTPEITLNVLSLDRLMAQGFVVTYGHNKCQISYMFEEDKEGCDGETDCATSKEVNGCDVETK
ncbi:hypothetical protein Tco_0370067 [Tanacetum coccineum]